MPNRECFVVNLLRGYLRRRVAWRARFLPVDDIFSASAAGSLPGPTCGAAGHLADRGTPNFAAGRRFNALHWYATVYDSAIIGRVIIDHCCLVENPPRLV